MKKVASVLAALLIALSLLSFAASADDPEVPVVNAIYGTPIIDGDVDAVWEGAQIIRLENVYQDDMLTTPTKVQFRVTYDEEYLYFLVEVEDSTMADLEWEKQFLGGNLWRRDGISFTFSPDNNRDITTGQVAPAFWFIIGAFGNTANWNNCPLNVFITEEQGFELTDAGDFEKIPLEKRMYRIVYSKDSSGYLTGYTIELKVNLKPKYEQIKLEPGTKIGFDLYSNDNNSVLLSASRNYGMDWVSINSYKNNAEKGEILLQPKGVAYDNTPPETTAEVTTEEVTTAEITTEEITTAEITTAEITDAEITTAEEPAPVQTTPEPTPATAEPEPAKKGCGGFAACGICVVALLGTAFVAKKRK